MNFHVGVYMKGKILQMPGVLKDSSSGARALARQKDTEYVKAAGF